MEAHELLQIETHKKMQTSPGAAKCLATNTMQRARTLLPYGSVAGPIEEDSDECQRYGLNMVPVVNKPHAKILKVWFTKPCEYFARNQNTRMGPLQKIFACDGGKMQKHYGSKVKAMLVVRQAGPYSGPNSVTADCMQRRIRECL